MVKKAHSSHRREEALSRDRIIEASIALLDSSGESGLTFRALSEELATGPGAIYWHIANKSDLLTAACDAIVARTLNASSARATPEVTIRVLALGMFDAIDAHPVREFLARGSRISRSLSSGARSRDPLATQRAAASRFNYCCLWKTGSPAFAGDDKFRGRLSANAQSCG